MVKTGPGIALAVARPWRLTVWVRVCVVLQLDAIKGDVGGLKDQLEKQSQALIKMASGSDGEGGREGGRQSYMGAALSTLHCTHSG